MCLELTDGLSVLALPSVQAKACGQDGWRPVLGTQVYTTSYKSRRWALLYGSQYGPWRAIADNVIKYSGP